MRRTTGCLLSVFILSACTGPSSTQPVSSKTRSSSPPSSPGSARPSVSPTPFPPLGTVLLPPRPRLVDDPDGWVRYRVDELGLSFAMPRIGAPLLYRAHRSDWNRHRLFSLTYLIDAYPTSGREGRSAYGLAGGTSARASDARECIPFDATGWTERNDGYAVRGPLQACRYIVRHGTVIPHTSGASALLFRSSEWFGDYCHERDLIAILPFPPGHHVEFPAITFDFDAFDDPGCDPMYVPYEPALPGFTPEDAETVIRGVRFFEPLERPPG